jgi:hypothetical protein
MGDEAAKGRAMASDANANDSLNLAELIPDHFARYFEFFRPGHQEGIVPARIKELARLKIAALNECDT